MMSNHKGFTITELLVVVSILSVLAGLSLSAGLQEWRREQVNAVTIELSGWLEQVRRSALRGRGCTATVNPNNLTSIGPNDTLASSATVAGSSSSIADSNACLTSSPLILPANANSSKFTLTKVTITFTPRGSAILPSNPTSILVGLSQSSESRCIRISDLLGLVDISKGTSCGNQERF